MAVQAQYPSNIFLFNRNEQEGHDDYLLPQPGGRSSGGVLLDQSNMMFANGGSGINPRKRGREAVMGSTITTPPTNVNNPINNQIFSIQQQQQQQLQLIDVSQLQNQTPPNVVSTGLRLSFGDQQQQLQQSHHYQQQQQSFTSQSSSSGLFSLVSDDFGIQIKRQREELDQFLQAQGEQLRRTLAEKRQNHYRTLLGAAEESIARQLRVKEAEVVKATRRNAELEARAAQLSMEAQVWQTKARAQEATAASLQAQLQQLQQAIMSGASHDRRKGDDALGCAGALDCQAEDAESVYVDPDRVTAVQSGPSCKSCRRRAASVVLLPCRHLCVCAECDQVINACPSCRHVRESSVEVFMF